MIVPGLCLTSPTAFTRVLILAGMATLCLAAGISKAGAVELPGRAPIPQSRDEALKNGTDKPAEPSSRRMPAAEQACRRELRSLGVIFAPAPPVEAPGGCALPHPITVTGLSASIRVKPAAILNCRTALSAALLFQGAGMAAARKHLKARMVGVQNASAYVCRPINGAKNLSEHAFGNALDVSAIVLSDGRQVAVRGHGTRGKSAEAKFLRDIRAAACGPFTTVLGPGTDAGHADHFHLDMKARRSPYCR